MNAAPKVKLENVTLMWANLDTQNSMSGRYQVDLTNLTPEHIEKVQSLGLVPKIRQDKPEKGAYIVCKSKFPIVPVDKSGAPINGAVGNGTKADVILSYYIPKKRPPGAPERSPSMLKLIITEMLEYIPASSEEDL